MRTKIRQTPSSWSFGGVLIAHLWLSACIMEITTIVCDASPMRRQTDGYLPSSRRYQIILLADVYERLGQGCVGKQRGGRELNPATC